MKTAPAPREVHVRTYSHLAWCLGVDERTIARWAKKGAPEKGEQGYSVREWVAWWGENIVAKPAASSAPDGDEDFMAAAAVADARKKIADANIAEEKLANLRGKLLDREQVERDRRARMAQFVAILGRACLELPPVLVGKSVAEIKRLMTGWVTRERREWLAKDGALNGTSSTETE